MNAVGTLKGLLLALGACCVLIGVMHIVFGPAIIPGASAANATMDSEDRFFGALFVAYGAACLWCAASVLERLTAAMLLAAVFFLGGIARLVSIAAVGLPHPFFVAMTAIEIVVPPLIVWLAIGTRRALTARVAGFPLLEHRADASPGGRPKEWRGQPHVAKN